MKVYVDQDLCIACGFCIDTCPAVFDWNDDGKSEAIVDTVPDGEENACRDAVEGCPTEAIKEI